MAKRLGELMHKDVSTVGDCIGPDVDAAVSKMQVCVCMCVYVYSYVNVPPWSCPVTVVSRTTFLVHAY